MSTNKRSLILLTPPLPEPPPAMVTKAHGLLMECDLAGFCSNLETARAMWRKYRELVEAPGYPEQLRAAFVAENGQEPSDDCGISGEEYLEPGWPENLLPQAVEAARGWMQKEREEDADANFLGEIGIVG
jgi:hypothetical protein